jgi:Rap1a immunity proteins
MGGVRLRHHHTHGGTSIRASPATDKQGASAPGTRPPTMPSGPLITQISGVINFWLSRGIPMLNRLALLFLLSVGTSALGRTTDPPIPHQITLAELKQLCGTPGSSIGDACHFYIWGLTEGASLAAEQAADLTHLCLPEGVSSGYVVELVRKKIIEDLSVFPKDKEMPAVSFVLAVVDRAYPCKNSNSEFGPPSSSSPNRDKTAPASHPEPTAPPKP